MKQIVRNPIFKHVKFVKGEGYKNITNNVEQKNGKGNMKEYGKCHLNISTVGITFNISQNIKL